MVNHTPAIAVLGRLAALDLSLCLRLRLLSGGRARALFVAVSRAGDGWLWLALAATLPLVAGDAGWRATRDLLAVGALSLPTYKLLKRSTARPRPCTTEGDLEPLLAPLDVYSFPSGHTLHAVAFTLVAVDHFGVLLWVLGPATLLIALSRLVLSLHYPSDVAAGAMLGGFLAWLVL
jgi:undecaprenyl-diphosphatase